MSTNREKWTKNSMNRRSLLKGAVALGLAACAGEGMAEEQQDKVKAAPAPAKPEPAGDSYEEPAKRLPARRFDVVVAGGGTAGVMAAIAAARQGAKTVLIESKGYTGGIITEGGTALHSFFNVWKPYPGAKKTQLVKGIPHEIIERLTRMGGTSGHAELSKGYLMFVKADVGGDWGTSKTWRVTDRDEMAKYELEARKLQQELIAKIRKVPGCETAFSARSSPVLNIRRGRVIKCDYDISTSDVLGGRHFDDDVMAYGFQDQEKPIGGGGGSFGIPYRALCAAEIENLLVAGMMITSAFVAHHSTRNTVSCMAQGQAVGTAAALCAAKNCMTRDLKYPELKKALLDGGVYLKS